MFLELDKKKQQRVAAIDDSGRKIIYGEICDMSIVALEYSLKGIRHNSVNSGMVGRGLICKFTEEQKEKGVQNYPLEDSQNPRILLLALRSCFLMPSRL